MTGNGAMQGRGVIVTGAADGLGREASIAFAQAGARVLLVDIDEQRLRDTHEQILSDGGHAVIHTADVRDEAQVEGYVQAGVQEFGSIDAFFNNAGILGARAPMEDFPTETFDAVLAVNLRGAFLGLKHVLRVMTAQRHGAIVNTASMGAVGAIPGATAYVASKHAVLGLTRNAAVETAADGVRINAVLPGNIVTKMGMGGDLETLTDEARKQREQFGAGPVPQGRMGTPREIADTVVFLCSDAASHITGACLPVDGGITAQVYPNRYFD